MTNTAASWLEEKRNRDVRLGIRLANARPTYGELFYANQKLLAEVESLRALNGKLSLEAAALRAANDQAYGRVQEFREHLAAFSQIGHVETPQQSQGLAGRILVEVCAFYKITLRELLQKRRYRPLSRQRHVAMYLLKRLTLLSYPKIGAMINRDHTTVMHGARKIENALQKDGRLQEEIGALVTILQTGGDNEAGKMD